VSNSFLTAYTFSYFIEFVAIGCDWIYYSSVEILYDSRPVLSDETANKTNFYTLVFIFSLSELLLCKLFHYTRVVLKVMSNNFLLSSMLYY
jgi:hypothetical protein